MRTGLILLSALALPAALDAQSPLRSQQSVSHPAQRTVIPGPASNFTGKVTVAPVVQPESPGRAVLGLVTFSPGARSNWNGATETTAMTHFAVSETLDGKNMVRAEPVTVIQYRAERSAR